MKILCDFDGTAAKNDVGNLLFRTFSDSQQCKEFVKSWRNGLISSKECLIQECRLTRVTRQELESFVDKQELDNFFKEFINFCQKKGLEVEIVSDGLDFYIDRILKNHNLDTKVKFRSNHLVFLNHNKIFPEFPYYEKGCGSCGNCKGYYVRQERKNGNSVIYVGDGYSDRCGAEEADIIFAKRDLLKYCQDNHLQYFEFRDFGDVVRTLKKILRSEISTKSQALNHK